MLFALTTLSVLGLSVFKESAARGMTVSVQFETLETGYWVIHVLSLKMAIIAEHPVNSNECFFPRCDFPHCLAVFFIPFELTKICATLFVRDYNRQH